MIFVRRQGEALAKEGTEVNLFYLDSRTSPRRLLTDFFYFRAELDRLRPSVIHAQFGTVTALFAALACGRLPLVITYRGSDLNPPPRTYRWRARIRAACGCLFSQLAALRAQKIICVSSPLRDRLWWRRDLVTILPTGVDPDVFYPSSQLQARRQLGWSNWERVVLFHAGPDVILKRLDLAREAVENASRKVPVLRLEILNGSVEPGSVPEMMNAADCLLVTSYSEGSPTVVQEALACNLPIVSVAVGDVVERFENVHGATVVPPQASVLGHALAQMVEPPRRSTGSLKIEEFSSRHIARRLQEIYARMMGI